MTGTMTGRMRVGLDRCRAGRWRAWKHRLTAECVENGPAAPGTRRGADDPGIVGEVCVQMPSRSTAIPGLCRVPRHLRSWPLDGSGEPPKPTHVQFRPSNQG
jgi:hypothetical protein